MIDKTKELNEQRNPPKGAEQRKFQGFGKAGSRGPASPNPR